MSYNNSSAGAPRPKRPGRPSRPSHHGASGSFYAGDAIPTLANFRRQSTYHYQTFPTFPPKTNVGRSRGSDAGSSSSDGHDGETPLPVRQLLLLALLSLSEQTALNSIGPYLPAMVASMPGIPVDQGGLYVGIVASAFALAQLSTNFLWGYTSDVIGRKPVLLAGTFSLMCCLVAFGFCRAYWQIVLIHVLMGMLNGNAACVPTVLGEVTDRSNQSRAFTYLPVVYSLGGITGPALGGILVGTAGDKYPYLMPNLLGAVLLALSVVAIAIWFEETLDTSEAGFWRPAWLERLASWIPKSPKRNKMPRSASWSARWPQRQSGTAQQPLLSSDSPTSSEADEGIGDMSTVVADDELEDSTKMEDQQSRPWRDLLNRTTILLLATYLVFQLSNISFNTLYPIFASSLPPTGRDLSAETIGVSLSAAGLATIVFQSFLYQPLKTKLGNLGTYRLAILGIAISMILMPLVGYIDGKARLGLGSGRTWLFAELGVVLVIKTICAVGGLSSVMLLITNSAPSHASLGTVNGVAQTLSALGRSIGPFASGGLFTLSTHLQPKGEALAWSLFGGLALVGWVGSMFIPRNGLESEDWEGDSEEQQHNDSEEVV